MQYIDVENRYIGRNKNKNYVTCLNAYLFIFPLLNKVFFSLCTCRSIVKIDKCM